MTSLPTFPLFSSLPTELRFKIWDLNLPGPRLIPLHYISATCDPSNPSTRQALRGCTSPAQIPINLHVNQEARSHALKYYQISFNLPHCLPKIWFNMSCDVLYFPAKAGWLGSWNHFVNTVTMTAPGELRKVKRLAVHEAVFRGVHGSNSSPNVQATCVKEFWAYVKKKFENIESVVVLTQESRNGGVGEDDMMERMVGESGYVLDKERMCIGSAKERLTEELEMGLRFVEAHGGWKAPKWDVLDFPGEEVEIDNWLSSQYEERASFGGEEKSQELLDRIIIPRRRVVMKEQRGFWMGGHLPYWHYLAKV